MELLNEYISKVENSWNHHHDPYIDQVGGCCWFSLLESSFVQEQVCVCVSCHLLVIVFIKHDDDEEEEQV